MFSTEDSAIRSSCNNYLLPCSGHFVSWTRAYSRGLESQFFLLKKPSILLSCIYSAVDWLMDGSGQWMSLEGMVAQDIKLEYDRRANMFGQNPNVGLFFRLLFPDWLHQAVHIRLNYSFACCLKFNIIHFHLHFGGHETGVDTRTAGRR